MTPTNTPILASLVFNATWGTKIGCRDINLYVTDPTGYTTAWNMGSPLGRVDHSANNGCTNCEPSPYEQISYPSPPSGRYTYWVQDPSCVPTPGNCSSLNVTLQVIKNGISQTSNVVFVTCGSTSNRYVYVY